MEWFKRHPITSKKVAIAVDGYGSFTSAIAFVHDCLSKIKVFAQHSPLPYFIFPSYALTDFAHVIINLYQLFPLKNLKLTRLLDLLAQIVKLGVSVATLILWGLMLGGVVGFSMPLLGKLLTAGSAWMTLYGLSKGIFHVTKMLIARYRIAHAAIPQNITAPHQRYAYLQNLLFDLSRQKQMEKSSAINNLIMGILYALATPLLLISGVLSASFPLVSVGVFCGIGVGIVIVMLAVKTIQLIAERMQAKNEIDNPEMQQQLEALAHECALQQRQMLEPVDEPEINVEPIKVSKWKFWQRTPHQVKPMVEVRPIPVPGQDELEVILLTNHNQEEELIKAHKAESDKYKALVSLDDILTKYKEHKVSVNEALYHFNELKAYHSKLNKFTFFKLTNDSPVEKQFAWTERFLTQAVNDAETCPTIAACR